ncbi:MAG: hypothetical protein BWY78_00200 [Alphaproteobacteria bacterium ADurb.Bin438]|nr:MAG: hypothetical protein BWY78_00200 [Alphaproteobacteria bacterium ADurb.Bin438]
MSKPSEGRFSANEFYNKNAKLEDVKAENKNIEHKEQSLGKALLKKTGEETPRSFEVEQKKEFEENANLINSNDDNDPEFEDDFSAESYKKESKGKYSKSKKGFMEKFRFLLSNIREMFIRRKLRDNSEIFKNLDIYSRNKILNEANYQELGFFTNATNKVAKLANETRYKMRSAIHKLKEYFDIDYQDPRKFIKDTDATLSERHTISLGGGIEISKTNKELIESIATKFNPMYKIKHKMAQELKEEQEEIELAEKQNEAKQVQEKLKEKKQERNDVYSIVLRRKLAYRAKPILNRKNTIRNSNTSFKPVVAKRKLPSLKRYIDKEGKLRIKTTWASLARRIQNDAKPFSNRLRSERILKIKNKTNKNKFIIPASLRFKSASF